MLFREFLEENGITLTAKHVRECIEKCYTTEVDGKQTKTETKVMYLRFSKPLPGDLDNKTYVCLSYHSRLAVEDKENKLKIRDLELVFDEDNGYGLIMPDGNYVANAIDLI